MSYRPTEYEVANGKGLGCSLRIDPESLLDGPLFFIVAQDDEEIVVTHQCLLALASAAAELAAQVK
jgi:hypothetical protein